MDNVVRSKPQVYFKRKFVDKTSGELQGQLLYFQSQFAAKLISVFLF